MTMTEASPVNDAEQSRRLVDAIRLQLGLEPLYSQSDVRRHRSPVLNNPRTFWRLREEKRHENSLRR